MLTDIQLKRLKPQEKIYKVTDRDGLYVAVSPTGTRSFRYDYRINGRRETLTIGQYGADGISLAEAREQLIAAKKLIKSGVSPAVKKRDGKNQIRNAETFANFTVSYMKRASLADSTRSMKQAVIDRDIIPFLGNKQMAEITPSMVRTLCDRIVDRGGNATAVQAREIISSVYTYAKNRGHDFKNPAQDIKASSIATFLPRDRTLSLPEISTFFNTLDTVAGMPTLKLALKLIFLTLVRKSEFTQATWNEVNFNTNEWTIPKGRMKGGRPHVVYLSRQACDLLVALQMCAGGSPYLLAGRYSINKSLSNAALNGVITTTVKVAQSQGKSLEHFTVHDMRRTASTLLHEAGYPSDWIEKCLAHEQKGVRAIYNKAKYAQQRTYMLQQWADMVDGWIAGTLVRLTPFSPSKYEESLKLEEEY
ncbi:tyrosine-type recombinase/integrase [Citrobacter portucalensis]|uniref:tyrosine-type recombinase/integrase n=1 Tax=Citrobacter portucalensis TaxID=1639133 RepID=UPI00226B756F|nr:site-specific integrase [Citrobacter portucalensis]MCX9061655.1 tyrosine-type recombinase/integrase [Citrobacter portucalensis]